MIHVVTPFSRPQNIKVLSDHLRPFGIQWHPLIHEWADFPQEPWIFPMVTKYPEDWISTGGICYKKVNIFIDAGISEADFYCVLCDDDLYQEGFFDIIRSKNGSVIIPSMRLQDGRELLAETHNMHPSRVGFEQIIIRGDVLKKYRYNNFCQADGQLIEKICSENTPTFAPEAFVLFNALQ